MLNTLPKHFVMTNVGPWEPQHFYDGNDALDLPTSPITDTYSETHIQMATSAIIASGQGIHPDPPLIWTVTPLEIPIK